VTEQNYTEPTAGAPLTVEQAFVIAPTSVGTPRVWRKTARRVVSLTVRAIPLKNNVHQAPFAPTFWYHPCERKGLNGAPY